MNRFQVIVMDKDGAYLMMEVFRTASDAVEWMCDNFHRIIKERPEAEWWQMSRLDLNQ